MKLIDTLSKKIGLGYLLITFVLAIAVLITIFLVQRVGTSSERLVNSQAPASRLSLETLNGINHSTAALRGWMLMKDSVFIEEKNVAWNKEIKVSFNHLVSLSKDWSDEQNIVRLNEVKPDIERLERLHDQIEDIVLADEEQAKVLMDTQAVPLALEVGDVLLAMTNSQEAMMSAEGANINNQITFLGQIEWALLGAGIIISITLGGIVTRSITNPISGAVEVANNIASGDFNTEVNVGGAKELKVLGNALINMRDSLKTKTEEAEKYNWITSGQNKLNEVLRGDKEVGRLSNDIVKFMAEYTGANIGSLFLCKNGNGTLILGGKYAFSKSDKTKNEYESGEGVIGQAAVNQKPIVLGALEQKDMRVISTIVDTPPKNVFVSPFVFENKTLGVMELGKFDDFNETHHEFMESTMESIAVAINSSMARKKIQQLLEETQRQSEELQSQQEELEQSNEELEEQAQKLKEQQEELQAANEELEEQSQIVEEKNKSLETARTDIELKAKQLEISSKYKSEFLANMSHELRTPLNSLLILSNDLLENADGNLNEDQLESAKVITKSGYDLLNLINEILDLSKIEAGKMDLNISEFNPKELASSLKSNFARLAERKELELNIKLEDSLPEQIKTDQKRLEQVIKNLVSNAVKFTENGSVTIDFKSDAGNNLIVDVIDTGVGISDDKQAVIFEAFQQAEGGISRKYGGTGLGLSISRELARLLGGRITLKSKLGEGSTFTLIIPFEVSKAEADEKPEPKLQKAKKVNTSNEVGADQYLNYPSIEDQRDTVTTEDHAILIIEDDNNFAQILANQAEEKGFKYIAAATGEDGLLMARKYQPEAIILDIDLPGINGHVVLRELKGDPELRHIPVHIMSVNEKTLDPIKSGAVEYLTKPISKDQLEEAFVRIEDFINRKMKNLLILEDDKNLRKGIVKLIGNGDVQCIEAGNGKDAYKLFKDQHIDCLVLDIGLPDMSGFDFIKKLEDDNDIKIPPIIVYTGKELTREENNLLQQYAETVIVKGVKSEERLLDETALFLHRTVKNLPSAKQKVINGLYNKESAFQNKKILLVDDDMRNVFALSKVLKEKSMNITKAENGVAALKALGNDPNIDLVLMDIMMPEMDGYECMRKIREQSRFSDLPIIALTAKAMKEDRQICIDAGANDYITKPVDVERLLSLMRVWIKK